MSEQNQLSPDWAAGLEGKTVLLRGCDYQIEHSFPILDGCLSTNPGPSRADQVARGLWKVTSGRSCLNVTCVQCENGKSISPSDSAQPTMAHVADTDSDLARPSDGKHPSAQHETPSMLLRSATRRRTAGHVVAHPGPSDSE
jgi:hypothetical protein